MGARVPAVKEARGRAVGPAAEVEVEEVRDRTEGAAVNEVRVAVVPIAVLLGAASPGLVVAVAFELAAPEVVVRGRVEEGGSIDALCSQEGELADIDVVHRAGDGVSRSPTSGTRDSRLGSISCCASSSSRCPRDARGGSGLGGERDGRLARGRGAS